jgi:hypothetical protein
VAPKAWAIQRKLTHGAVAGDFGSYVHVDRHAVNEQNTVISLSE